MFLLFNLFLRVGELQGHALALFGDMFDMLLQARDFGICGVQFALLGM